MKRLLEYLDKAGWKKTQAGSRRVEKDGWVYDWQAGDWCDVWSELRRWQPGRTEADEIDIFIIRNEEPAIEIAKKIALGIHLPSPALDRESQSKIEFIK